MPLDIKLFRDEPDKVRESQRRRFKPVEVVDEVIALDAEWRKAEFTTSEMSAELSKLSKSIGAKKKAKEDCTELMEQVKTMKAKQAESKEACVAKRQQLDKLISTVGNIVDDSCPVSNDEEKDCEVVAEFGEFGPAKGQKLHHHQLLFMIGGAAYEQGVTVAGHRGYFLTGPAVLLNQAIINFALTFAMKRGMTPLQPPYMMNKPIMAETAQLEQFDEELYKVTGDGTEKYLIATSEQPISAFHRREWIEPSTLPIRYAGISTCFRKEAGAHGKDAWGIFRVHQFEKVEQFVLCDPEDSVKHQEELITNCKDFCEALGFPYRVINVVSGELNNAAAKKYDLECWFPTLGTYRELVSCSNCTDYQSRAMETRFGQKKMGDREKKYVHMLNSTLAATTRVICCLLENYQTDTGVTVPEVLRPFMGGMDFMPFTKPCPLTGDDKKRVKKEKEEAARKEKEARKAAAAAEKKE
jgi:seryl-tRNA synthetase